MQKLNWQAFSNRQRVTVIEEVKGVISRNEGYITNFNMYSDLAMSLSIEIEEKRIQALHLALSERLTISPRELSGIDERSDKDWLIFMNISFGSGTGKLKREIPSVPG